MEALEDYWPGRAKDFGFASDVKVSNPPQFCAGGCLDRKVKVKSAVERT